jgi:hypothetical protein
MLLPVPLRPLPLIFSTLLVARVATDTILPPALTPQTLAMPHASAPADATPNGGPAKTTQTASSSEQHAPPNPAASIYRRRYPPKTGSQPAAFPRASAAPAGARLPQASLVPSGAAILAWVICSGVRVFANKALYLSGFPYPLAVTGLCQAVAFFVAIALTHTGAFPYRPCQSWWVYLSAALPASAATAATLYTGNRGVMLLPVTFVQIIKGLTPSFTLVLAVVTGTERLTLPLAATVGLISLGSGVSCWQQGALPGFHRLGCALQVCSP